MFGLKFTICVSAPMTLRVSRGGQKMSVTDISIIVPKSSMK